MTTIPAHQLQSGDRVNLHGHWRTVGRVTVENYDTGSEVHVVLDEGKGDARIDAHQQLQVERSEQPTAISSAGAAGWDDESGYRCIHHGHEGDEPCPDCHPHGLNLDAARGVTR